jgi:hypothetical protein
MKDITPSLRSAVVEMRAVAVRSSSKEVAMSLLRERR